MRDQRSGAEKSLVTACPMARFGEPEGKSFKADKYGAAVEYYFFQNRDLDKALTLSDMAMDRNPVEPMIP